MVLHSAQYKRQNNEEAAFEDVMDSNIHGGNTHVPSTSQSRTGSIINSNSISLSDSRMSSGGTGQDLIGRPVRRSDSNNEDTMSTGSDRLCNAPEGHVRFVNSTIRYHMAGPGFW